ncbi:MAG: MATE family multidrug resistance protein [Cyclobacteriaceae bacterium]
MNNLSLKEHFRRNFTLAFPIVIGQVGHIMVSVADTMMVGKTGVIPLAAATFAGTFYHVLMIFGIGVSYAITPLVAATDSKDQNRLIKFLQNGLGLNMSLSIILVGIGLLISPFLGYFGQEPQVAIEARPYLIIMCISLIPLMHFQTYRQFSEGLSDTFNPMMVSIIANLLNIVLNYILIYGAFGIPAYGLIGAGYATLIARVVMAVLMHRSIKKKLFGFKWQFDWHIMKSMLHIGVPSGMQYVFEIGAFAVAAIMAGWISAEAQASHQIAINLVAVSYMAASGLGAAGTIRIGNQMGLNNLRDLKIAGYSLMLTVIVFMACCGAFFITFRYELVSLYIENETVTNLAAGLLIVAAAFQISDGMQAVGLGILRGLTDVKIPTLVTFIAYWLIAIPIGYVLGFVFDYGVYGIWYGLLGGLTLSAILHLLRFKFLVSRLKF